MKVLIPSSAVIPTNSANLIASSLQAIGFEACGHDVALLLRGNASSLRSLVVLSEKLGFFYSARLITLKYRLAAKSKLIFVLLTFWHASWNHYDLIVTRDSVLALLLTAFTKSRVFLELHNDPVFMGWSIRISFSILTRLRSNRLRIAAISGRLATTIRQRYSLADVALLRSATLNKINLDTALCKDSKITQNTYKVANLKSASRFTVGYFGSFYKGRGLDLLLKVAKMLPEVTFLLVGADNIQSLDAKYDNVIILASASYAQSKLLMRMYCSVLVAPYQTTVNVYGNTGDTSSVMSPLKLFDYMESCKPFIVSRLPIIQEFLTEDVDCLMAHPESADEWTESILTLMNSPEISSRLASYALSNASLLTWGERAAAITSLFPLLAG